MNMSGMKKLAEIQEEVKRDLEHIPKGDFSQNMLRQYYCVIRMNSLGKKSENPNASCKELLRQAIDAVRKDHPEFEARFDIDYFKK